MMILIKYHNSLYNNIICKKVVLSIKFTYIEFCTYQSFDLGRLLSIFFSVIYFIFVIMDIILILFSATLMCK